MVGGWECLRCEGTWAKRKDAKNIAIKPLRCALCGSVYWDLPIKNKKKDEEEKEL